MIRTDNRNASVGENVMRRKSLVECTGSLSTEPDSPTRGGIPKSKSSSQIEFYAASRGDKGDLMAPLSSFRLLGRKSTRKWRDTRTVKSEATYVSPSKRDSPKGHSFRYQSPTSPSETKAFTPLPGQETTHTLSITVQDAQPSTHAESRILASPLMSSSSFSDEETIELSIENGDRGSFPMYCRLSSSNMSVPSDLSSSYLSFDFHFSPPKRHGSARRHVMARPLRSDSIASASADCTPLPPTRRGSGRTTSTGMEDTMVVVPSDVHCCSTVDASPFKPARRTSISDGTVFEQSVSTLHTSFTSDSAPTKPNRQRSVSHDNNDTEAQRHESCSTASLDTSPHKPERQNSTRFVSMHLQRLISPSCPLLQSTVSRSCGLRPVGGRCHNSIAEEFPDLCRYQPTLLARTISGSGDILLPPKFGPTACPPRRTISRSESMARPRMPALARRDSITEDPTESQRRSSSMRVDIVTRNGSPGI